MAQRILIAEDEPSLRAALANVAKKIGLEHTAVGDGQAAVDILATSTVFDLVLLDIIMPKLNGIDVLRRMRINGNKAPVIILSNLESEIDMTTATQLGAMQYIVKSNVSLKDVEKVLRDALSI